MGGGEGRQTEPAVSGGNRNLSVFINCPYDADYQPIFDAIVFASVCCGYIPRCAIETDQVAEPRIRRIVRALKGCKYSIHDLCRCQGQGDKNLARFNMPLELGIAMAERFDDSKPANWHDWLLLVPPGHSYGNFISDLAGYDPKSIEQRVDQIVPAVMSWLLTREDAVAAPCPQDILDLLPTYMTARHVLGTKWLGHEPWKQVVAQAISVGQGGGIIPK